MFEIHKSINEHTFSILRYDKLLTELNFFLYDARRCDLIFLLFNIKRINLKISIEAKRMKNESECILWKEGPDKWLMNHVFVMHLNDLNRNQSDKLKNNFTKFDLCPRISS